MLTRLGNGNRRKSLSSTDAHVALATFWQPGGACDNPRGLDFPPRPRTVESAVRARRIGCGGTDSMPRHPAKTKQSDFSASEARRIALAAQGFDRAPVERPRRARAI